MRIIDRFKKREVKEKKRKVSLTLLLVAAGVIIVGVTVLLLITLNTKKIEDGVYFYDTGVRFDKQGAVIRNDNENGVYLENSGGSQGTQDLTLTSAPLYYADQSKIFIPVDCTITLPSQRKVSKIPQFTEFEDRQGTTFALVGRDEYEISEGFLYDGQNTFIFFDDMTVSYNGKAISLPRFSYAVVVYNQRVEFYPYGGDPVVEQTGQTSVTASADNGYTIDLGSCLLTNAEGFESLLISQPSLMEPFSGE